MGVWAFYILFVVIAWPIKDRLDPGWFWWTLYCASLFWCLCDIRDFLRMVTARAVLSSLDRERRSS
jgi:hypothetical protein